MYQSAVTVARRGGIGSESFDVLRRRVPSEELSMAMLAESVSLLANKPVSLANEYARMIQTRGWDYYKLSGALHQTVQSVKNTLSLLRLDPCIQTVVESGQVGVTVGYLLAVVPDRALQVSVMKALAVAAVDNGGKIRRIDAQVAVARALGKPMPKSVSQAVAAVADDTVVAFRDPAERRAMAWAKKLTAEGFVVKCARSDWRGYAMDQKGQFRLVNEWCYVVRGVRATKHVKGA